MKQAILAVKDAAFGYGTKAVLRNVNFSVEPGTLAGLVGPNGIGKSTLLQTLRGLLPPVQGIITINGKNIAALGAKDFARQAAYLRQHNDVPFAYTVREVVEAGRYPYLKWWEQNSVSREDVVEACMQYMQVKELQDKPVNQLSGGQRQRVFLAKALAQQTEILFLDEPTADLDFVFTEELFQLAKLWTQAGKTVIMAVHELSLAYKYCSKILLLGKGKLLAEGIPEEVMTEENLSASYGVPLTAKRNPVTGGIDVKASVTYLKPTQKNLLSKICK